MVILAMSDSSWAKELVARGHLSLFNADDLAHMQIWKWAIQKWERDEMKVRNDHRLERKNKPQVCQNLILPLTWRSHFSAAPTESRNDASVLTRFLFLLRAKNTQKTHSLLAVLLIGSNLNSWLRKLQCLKRSSFPNLLINFSPFSSRRKSL